MRLYQPDTNQAECGCRDPQRIPVEGAVISLLSVVYHYLVLLKSSLLLAPAIVVGLALIIIIALYLSGRSHLQTATSADPFPSWDSSQDWESLKAVFAATEKEGESAIRWYRDNIKSKRFGSRFIRLLAISLASIGALIPLVATQLNFNPEWGYFSFATVIVLLGIDKFYGFSTGWVRYLKTQMDLERGLSDLRYDWTALVSKVQTQSPSAEQIQVMLQKLKDFVDFVHAQIQQETEAWVLEFQASLSDLMTSVKAQSDATKPGSLQVTVKNAEQFDSVSVNLDQLTEMPVQGGQCFFPSVATGSHAVSARATKAGIDPVVVSDVVKVSAGSSATLVLTLIVPSQAAKAAA